MRAKKRKLKKWLEKTLIIINTLIFSFIAMINDFNFKGFIIIIVLLLVFTFNHYLISKYTDFLKD